MRLSFLVLVWFVFLVACGFNPSGNTPGGDDDDVGVDAVPSDGVIADAAVDAEVDAPPLVAEVTEFTKNPDIVRLAAGHPVRLDYSATARRCVGMSSNATDNWNGELLPDSGGISVTGSHQVVPVSGQNAYDFHCFGDEGSEDQAVQLKVDTLVMEISDPDYTITQGSFVSLHWQSPGTADCDGRSQDLSGGPMNGGMPQQGGQYPSNGTFNNFSPNESGDHTFRCPVNGVDHIARIRITVTPP